MNTKKTYSQISKERDEALVAFFTSLNTFNHPNKDKVTISDFDLAEKKAVTKFINMLK